jgi:hypothetical protein
VVRGLPGNRPRRDELAFAVIADQYRDLPPLGRRMVRVLLAAYDGGEDAERNSLTESQLTDGSISDRAFVQLMDRGVMHPYLGGLYGFTSPAEAERAREAVATWDAEAWAEAMQTPRRRLSPLAV